MYDLRSFRLAEMNDLCSAMRRISAGAQTMEQVAGRAVTLLYDELGAGPERACALVRLYKTHMYGELEGAQQEFARRILGETSPDSRLPCLALLATRGDEPAWNDRRRSRGHQAIPLPSERMLSGAPMIAELVRQMGVDVRTLLATEQDAIMLEAEQRSYNVFHVPESLGSRYIPAQDEFVRPYGIHSVLGFGGVLPLGGMFAMILFSRAGIDRDTAEAFKPVAVALKVALVPFAAGPFFDSEAGGEP